MNANNKKKELPKETITKLNSFSIEEARGFTIERLYEIEIIIDDIILNFFKSKNSWEFKKIILNGNILDFGKKIKILSGLEIINNKLADKLRRISSIRNSCAHAEINIVHELKIFSDDASKEEREANYSKKRLDVMKSNGKIEEKLLIELLIEFSQFYIELKDNLFSIRFKQSSNQTFEND
ncbi:hypothetical protein Q4Q34_08675 [Flavivirga abyssicola]|uniref:hypothetical protein n=1 Tax=Flavivirga abyssicola TaxID=3063533 RepID=UPI0026E0DB4B|nr:hypothetical protein [Flavivirga sp. MEBiC07777]WVK15101.1 hypothetical protein Q4Q34_08675 [Flavivirga sp. MEBiC07777]